MVQKIGIFLKKLMQQKPERHPHILEFEIRLFENVENLRPTGNLAFSLRTSVPCPVLSHPCPLSCPVLVPCPKDILRIS